MKIIVAIKRALDYTARVRVKPDGTGVDLSGARMSMNPFCEIALEVRKRESMGIDGTKETMTMKKHASFLTSLLSLSSLQMLSLRRRSG